MKPSSRIALMTLILNLAVICVLLAWIYSCPAEDTEGVDDAVLLLGVCLSLVTLAAVPLCFRRIRTGWSTDRIVGLAAGCSVLIPTLGFLLFFWLVYIFDEAPESFERAANE